MSGQGGLGEALFVDRGSFDPQPPRDGFVAMQRAVVRMLFDPAFVSAVYDSAGEALEGLDLAPGLVAQLLGQDRRLWNADRLRRARALKILYEEFKTACTLALAEGRKLALLDGFFSSPRFHEAVHFRGYMALAFASHLEDVGPGSPHFRAALALESAMARSRRLFRDARRGLDHAARRSGLGMWTSMPGVVVVALPQGTMALVQHVEQYLFRLEQVPGLALCDDAPRPEPLPPLSEQADVWLLEPRAGGKVDVSEISAAFGAIIQTCEAGADLAALRRALEPLDAAQHAEDYVAQLVEAGVISTSTGARL